MTLLLQTAQKRSEVWSHVFAAANEPLICGADNVSDPAEVEYLACWVPPPDLSIYPNLRAVISVGAGVDQMPPMPSGVQLCRTLAQGIEEMVRDWVVMSTLMLFRGMPTYLTQAQSGEWKSHDVPLARNARVGIMGMGRIGQLAAKTLGSMGFHVAGWSRSGRSMDGVQMFGETQRAEFLSQSDVLICLLPLTPETHGVLNTDLFAQLPQGAHLVHAGRGAQIDMAALQHALDAGRLASAMLDVTNPEPLPDDHWAWRDARVIVTPHIAANTDDHEGAQHALNVIKAARAGVALPGLVDLQKGY